MESDPRIRFRLEEELPDFLKESKINKKKRFLKIIYF